jgi:O-antigen/teichoic acid export membrane protein
MMITLITSGIQMAWRPYSMSMKDKENSPWLFAKIYMALLLLGLFGVIAVATVSPWIMKMFFDSQYYEAYPYVSFLSCVTFLNFYYLIISAGLFFTKQTAYITRVFIIAAFLNIILNFMLVPFWIGWGAVVANIFTYAFAVWFIFQKSQEIYYVPVSLKKMAFLFVNGLISLIAIVYIQETAIHDGWVVLGWVYFLVMVLISRVDVDFRAKPSHVQPDMEKKMS